MSYRSVFQPGTFEGKTIVVTGAGSGIGRCITHELSSLGAQVVLIGRTQQKLDAVIAELAEDGLHDAKAYSCDIRDEVRVCEVVGDIVQQLGPIHGLVNNAGGQFPSALSEISMKGFEAVIRSNLVGGFVFAREVFNQSMKATGGSIVNITCDCVNGFPIMGHTGAARAGMDNLTKTAAWEWGPYQVRVNAVAPGIIASSGFDTYDPKFQQKFLQFANGIPLKRLGNEAELSAAVCFLLSPAASYINGATLPVTGGSEFGMAPNVAPLPEEPFNRQAGFDGFHRSVKPKILRDHALHNAAVRQHEESV